MFHLFDFFFGFFNSYFPFPPGFHKIHPEESTVVILD